MAEWPYFIFILVFFSSFNVSHKYNNTSFLGMTFAHPFINAGLSYIIAGVTDVIFETDSISVSHALLDPANAKITIPSLVAGTHSKLHEFRSFEVSHVKRQANFPARALAACICQRYWFLCIMMEECPPLIESQAFHDALSLSSY